MDEARAHGCGRETEAVSGRVYGRRADGVEGS
ncbi:hypothetical protein Aros01_03960 [Streptosporangium roseum]|uniref:Uncharacterized protein n=1 Tax=Streptosporangium roseum (strain ATCC 12428 / DSM 43021 / JCM 3005 / KCTC 9067 / NCIMB 10171 / NRRL 2505 / NI 9100) TaxID=479432 RepID=D2AS75_STRRD|nr:hypothetical protein Sros_3674 [Streptosporangium roseum DSM 43021]